MLRDGKPLVTLTNRVWKALSTQAAGHMKEAGGLLIGRKTRCGTYLVSADIALAREWSDSSQLFYADDEVERTRQAANESFKPLCVVGEWHTHPWENAHPGALRIQISAFDKKEMLEGELELVIATIPSKYNNARLANYRISRIVGERICRAEAHVKTDGKVHVCKIQTK